MSYDDVLGWVAQDRRADARSRGRGERYTVHAVMTEEIEETP